MKKFLLGSSLIGLSYTSSALAGVDLPSPSPDLIQNIVLLILSIIQIFSKKKTEGK